MQARFIEEETHRRIEDVVNKRVEEELAKKKIDIDEEVNKKVEEAKRQVEKHLKSDYDRKTQDIIDEYAQKEVELIFFPIIILFINLSYLYSDLVLHSKKV